MRGSFLRAYPRDSWQAIEEANMRKATFGTQERS
jgi:hypothetical protein